MDRLDGVWTPPAHTDQLPVLRSQRALVASLITDVVEVKRRLVSVDPSEFWRSSAQLAYRERVGEIVADLQIVLNLLDEAQDYLWQNIVHLESQ
ncbi:hypothetical protein E3T39_03445 [Cryobacterium suzukii]|uniref:Uncharacterized protein n=1 Tax=Cryobacterium suzukii TaxID=1259198 RepID=A0A4R9AHU5_9MICO|nr:hypothetical protein [Cryobacterium suzukii]TFD62077.1 hypothetical protein E3T39_03445 [Cryobacterium suzukii]